VTASEKVSIVADFRERSRVRALLEKNENVLLQVNTLEAGDYVVSDRCAISLKATPFDFCTSLSKGSTAKPHIFDEIERLKEAYERPVLIINGVMSFDFRQGKSFAYRKVTKEGKEFYARKDLHRHPASILGAIATIARQGVSVIRTSNENEAAQLIYRIAWQEQIGEKRPLRIQKAKKAGLTLAQRQKMIVESLAEGVGPALAEKLLEEFKTIRNIVNASEEDLKKVEGIGEEKAKRIVLSVTGEYRAEAETSEQDYVP